MKIKIPKNFNFERGRYNDLDYRKVDYPERQWDSENEKTVYEIDRYSVYTTKRRGGLFLAVYTGDDYPYIFDAQSLLDMSKLLAILETQYPIKETENES